MEVMGQAGSKQQLFSVPTPLAPESGRYAVSQGRSDEATATPAADAHAARATALRLLEINALSAEELAWIEARRTQSKSEPVRGLTSAVFAKEGEDPTFEALRPFYREPTLERVQLQFEDRSLDPAHNPLALSSLRPPPRRAVGPAGVLAIGVAVLALAGVGYLAEVAGSGAQRQTKSLTLPVRMAKSPRVINPVPTSDALTAQAQNRASAATEAGGAGVVADEVLWSSPAAATVMQPATAAVAPVAQVVAAPVVAGAGTGTEAVSAAVRRRRLLAWRARTADPRAQAARAAALGPSLAMPTQPSREQIRVGLDSARAALQTCAGVLHGTSTAHVTIASSGRVASATIEGAFAGTPAGSCMARALRDAVFPRFSDPNLQVTYPFRL
jgi:hypothetical protein